MRRCRTVILFAIVILLMGCFFKKVPVKRFYLLDYIPTPPTAKRELALRPVTLRIKDFDVAETYNRPEIVYRKSAHEMEFYNYHRWAVKPEYMITDMVFKHLKTANLFKSISRTLSDFKPDYTLTGQVQAIEEYDNKEKWFAHLAITLYLEDNKSKRHVWQKTYDVRKTVAQQEPVFVIRELSYLLEYIMDQVVEELGALLPKYLPPKNSSQKKPDKESNPEAAPPSDTTEQKTESPESEE